MPTFGKRNCLSQISNPTLNLKDLEKEEKTKPRVSRGKEITKITLEIK